MILTGYQLATIGGKPEVLATWRDSDGPLLSYHNLKDGRCIMPLSCNREDVPDLPTDVLAALQNTPAAEFGAVKTILEAMTQ